MSLTSTRNGWRPSGSRRWRGSASAALTAVRTAGIGASRKTVPAAVKPAWLRLGHPHELRANRCRLPGLLFTPRGQPRHASSRRRCSPIRPGPQETGSLFRRSVPRPRRRTETTGKKTGGHTQPESTVAPEPLHRAGPLFDRRRDNHSKNPKSSVLRKGNCWAPSEFSIPKYRRSAL